jgi:cellulose synthase/poly-beta-1,6-N-acetylglucosamine synthase-like glycosyltransferase
MSACDRPPPPETALQRFDRLADYFKKGRAPWRKLDDSLAFLTTLDSSQRDERVSPPQFRRSLRERFAEELDEWSVWRFAKSFPLESAHRLDFNWRDRRWLLVLSACVAIAIIDPRGAAFLAMWALSAIPLIFLLCRVALTLLAPAHAETSPPLSNEALPAVTILAPMFREAASVRHFVRSISALDYPPSKLQVQILLEEEDRETCAAFEGLRLGDHFDIVVVPHLHPQTKPKACNYGLATAFGELLVIYDAEDEPEPDQLRKAAARFAAAPADVACLQAKLSIYNRNDGWLSRQFALEYALWFDHMLPGLARLGAPIPLGGTSNVFRTDVLKSVGGWDPFNVTEDAELGLRLARRGWRVEVLDSTTWEEAPTSERAWIRQRTRWLKGYMQTWLAHRRCGGLSSLSLISADLFLGAAALAALTAPLLWAIALLDVANPGWSAPATQALALAQIIFVVLAAYAPLRRGFYSLAPWAMLAPFYWTMISIAAWRALFQLGSAPSFWEKTEHGATIAAHAARRAAVSRHQKAAGEADPR